MFWFELDEDCIIFKCVFFCVFEVFCLIVVFFDIYIWKNEFKYFIEKEYLDYRLIIVRIVVYGSDKVNDSKLIFYVLIFIMV